MALWASPPAAPLSKCALLPWQTRARALFVYMCLEICLCCTHTLCKAVLVAKSGRVQPCNRSIAAALASLEVTLHAPPASGRTRAHRTDASRACVQPWAAVIIGIVSGCVYCSASFLIANVLKIDDPLDAAAVHGFCGTAGVLMAAAFSYHKNHANAYGNVDGDIDFANGFLYGGNGRLFGCAVVFCLAIIAWVLGHMVPFFFLTRFTGLLRVDEAEERAGLDVSHHGGGAYEPTGTAELADAGNGKHKSMNGEHEALLSRCAPPPLRAVSVCSTCLCVVAERAMHLVAGVPSPWLSAVRLWLRGAYEA